MVKGPWNGSTPRAVIRRLRITRLTPKAPITIPSSIPIRINPRDKPEDIELDFGVSMVGS